MIQSHTETLIVGGGPAGLATAIALRQRGVQCTVVDARSPEIDKACGEGLMPDAISTLHSLGVEIDEEDGPAFRGIRFINSSNRAEAEFPHSPGFGVRRTHLHNLLVERAKNSDVTLQWKTHTKLLDRNTALINGRQISFNWLIGADGNSSYVRRWAKLDRSNKQSMRYGFRRHYRIKPWSEYVEVYWVQEGQLYVTPVSSDCVCVVFVGREPIGKQGDFLELFPSVAERVSTASILGPQRGSVTTTRKLRRVVLENIALVGDASGSTDAITGEGLSAAFRQALALAKFIKAGDLELYAIEHREISKLPHAMASLLLMMDRWAFLRECAIRTLEHRPDIFRDLLSVHVGAAGIKEFILTRGPQFGWQMICHR